MLSTFLTMSVFSFSAEVVIKNAMLMRALANEEKINTGTSYIPVRFVEYAT
jgi:hypothetical protein